MPAHKVIVHVYTRVSHAQLIRVLKGPGTRPKQLNISEMIRIKNLHTSKRKWTLLYILGVFVDKRVNFPIWGEVALISNLGSVTSLQEPLTITSTQYMH